MFKDKVEFIFLYSKNPKTIWEKKDPNLQATRDIQLFVFVRSYAQVLKHLLPVDATTGRLDLLKQSRTLQKLKKRDFVNNLFICIFQNLENHFAEK